MNEMEYQMIFKRKSFHLFKNTGNISDKDLAQIEDAFLSCRPLFPEIKVDMRIVPADQTTCKRGQEYCILLYSEKKDGYKGRSQTSCPNPDDWLRAFGEAEEVYCVAITSGLSGSYNAACIAKEMYEEAHPGRRVYVIDSLSAGPELTLMVHKLEELIVEGKSFEEIEAFMPGYLKQTGLLFSLECLNNFAANGRVSPTVAKLAGVLGIRIVGKASDAGTLEPTDKCRGEGKAVSTIMKRLKENGLRSGTVQIAHCWNEKAANSLKAMIEAEMPEVTVNIGPNLGLCSYYAERGGMLVGYEKF